MSIWASLSGVWPIWQNLALSRQSWIHFKWVGEKRPDCSAQEFSIIAELYEGWHSFCVHYQETTLGSHVDFAWTKIAAAVDCPALAHFHFQLSGEVRRNNQTRFCWENLNTLHRIAASPVCLPGKSDPPWSLHISSIVKVWDSTMRSSSVHWNVLSF